MWTALRSDWFIDLFHTGPLLGAGASVEQDQIPAHRERGDKHPFGRADSPMWF